LPKGCPSVFGRRTNSNCWLATGLVERAKKSLDDAKIEAPFAGTVADVFKQSGEQASPGEAIIHLVDLSEVKVTLDVTKDGISQFLENAKVQIVSDDGSQPGRLLAGRHDGDGGSAAPGKRLLPSAGKCRREPVPALHFTSRGKK